MAANTIRGSHEEDHYELFDRLPWRFRRLLSLAHTDLKVGWLLSLLKRLRDEHLAYDTARRAIWTWRLEDIEQDYGPDHPGLR